MPRSVRKSERKSQKKSNVVGAPNRGENRLRASSNGSSVACWNVRPKRRSGQSQRRVACRVSAIPAPGHCSSCSSTDVLVLPAMRGLPTARGQRHRSLHLPFGCQRRSRVLARRIGPGVPDLVCRPRGSSCAPPVPAANQLARGATRRPFSRVWSNARSNPFQTYRVAAACRPSRKHPVRRAAGLPGSSGRRPKQSVLSSGRVRSGRRGGRAAREKRRQDAVSEPS